MPQKPERNEGPIIFSGPMINAIRDDRKTKTRRVLKFPRHAKLMDDIASVNPDGKNGWVAWGPHPVTDEFSIRCYPKGGGFPCPYGQVGSRLWVKETFSLYRGFADDTLPDAPVIYRADKDACGQYPVMLNGESVLVNQRNPWTPSIYMPRRLSRIMLEVTSIKVERVQDITEDDAIAEGMEVVPIGTSTWSNRESFMILWDKINKKRGFGWDTNPFVWVISFKRIKP